MFNFILKLKVNNYRNLHCIKREGSVMPILSLKYMSKIKMELNFPNMFVLEENFTTPPIC